MNNTLLIFRAVEDKRKNIIRILAAMDLSIDKSLITIKANGVVVPFGIQVLGKIIKFNIQFPLKYVNFIVANIAVKSITVNDENIDFTIIKKIDYKYDFTVCVSSVKNNFTAKKMLDQTLNIYQKEGVNHAIIYYEDISKEVFKVLNKYVEIGFLEIYFWPKLDILSYIRNYGQILKMNDCLYRSYFNSRYIINSDIDEIIMPKTYYTLKKLINRYLYVNPNCTTFEFLSKTFPTKNYIDKNSKYGRSSYLNLPSIEDVNLFNKTYSCKETILRKKYIVSTRYVDAIRFHDVVSEVNYICRINRKDGHCRHTRIIPINNRHLCYNLTKDLTIMKYK